jgi:hypothetical protein
VAQRGFAAVPCRLRFEITDTGEHHATVYRKIRR